MPSLKWGSSKCRLSEVFPSVNKGVFSEETMLQTFRSLPKDPKPKQTFAAQGIFVILDLIVEPPI